MKQMTAAMLEMASGPVMTTKDLVARLPADSGGGTGVITESRPRVEPMVSRG